jgi:hypothetical protein
MGKGARSKVGVSVGVGVGVGEGVGVGARGRLDAVTTESFGLQASCTATNCSSNRAAKRDLGIIAGTAVG